MDPARGREPLYTAAGIAALVFWSTSVALVRSLAEQVGLFTSAACTYLVGGVLGCLYVALVERRLLRLVRLPGKYLLGCGLMFVGYAACLYLAIGLSAGRQQVVEVGILNYLWPALTLVLAVPLRGVRVRPAFWPGVIVALAGAALAPLRPGEYSAATLAENLRLHPLPYVLALAAAVLWALYSNLSRRWAGRAEGGAVPLFVLATGLTFAALRLAFPEPSAWTPRAAGEMLFVALATTLVAYGLWDAAMRRGDADLVAALSNGTPLASTLVSALYLGVAVGWNAWLGCALLVAGAALCRASVVRDRPPADRPRAGGTWA